MKNLYEENYKNKENDLWFKCSGLMNKILARKDLRQVVWGTLDQIEFYRGSE